MNKKDMKKIAEDGGVTALGLTAEELATTIQNAVGAALENVLESVKTGGILPPVRTSRLWFQMFCSVVGGQVGWISSALTDPERMEKRVKTLMEIATYAVNLAIRERKISVQNPSSATKSAQK